jgi:hypothetical protein
MTPEQQSAFIRSESGTPIKLDHTIRAFWQHSSHEAVAALDLPDDTGMEIDLAYYAKVYTITFGQSLWVCASGHAKAPRQFVIWYPNGEMWSSYGKSIKDAFEKAFDRAAFYI